MGGLFALTSARDVQEDVFFGTDYHSHLGNYRAGLVVCDSQLGFQREIHNIQRDSFRSRFATFLQSSRGQSGIGCIADDAPSPLIISSHLGTYAICFVGAITNSEELIQELLAEKGVLFNAHSRGRINPTEIISALISLKDSFEDGIAYVQSKIEGSCNLAILLDDGSLIIGRDKLGRLPMIIGRDDDGYAVSFESFSFEKLGYRYVSELGPAEVVKIRPDGIEQLRPAQKEMKICSFLWNYYGYPTSTYENVNVEIMRNRNGEILAQNETDPSLFERLDYVCGVPDSGTPHAMGYAFESNVKFARCYIKYTPTWARSFLPHLEGSRNEIAKMKQVPIKQLINGKNILFVDDSIVRGTQLRETVEFLKENGAHEVHMRSACPPMMYTCKFLNFSVSTSENDLITRRIILQLEGPEGLEHIEEYADQHTERGKRLRSELAQQFNFDSIEFQSLEGIIQAIGLNPQSLCTYCWSGRE
ncbi:amidophosphoribosyltransferase [Arcanobacterium pinnipediorum]|uniref:Amidophosphoribosyltransferase n=1 Tax=Arcanobacterium pinnipediorum TaxID=1503041 RepID=A0ABY5AIU8_9ACTO|nr:amidophosphoribosyltransferase [Arcanobacterium pinnipediorum]USR80135.1 amidophosphoribosyltransferase [Arcanobacterium pinnipediorum]